MNKNKLIEIIRNKFKNIFEKEFKNFDLKVDFIDIRENDRKDLFLDVLMINLYENMVFEFNIFFNFFEYNLISMNYIVVLLDINLLSSLVIRKLEMISNDSLKYNTIDFELCSQIEDLNMKLKDKKLN
jgi:hypothetical protein|nr:MAG TPA: hypothetical protein [Herelleviridae sp.]